MSYILDALRKAERDRNLGRTPSLGDVTAPKASRPVSHRPSNRTLALIALVVVLLASTVWFWPRRPAADLVAPPPAAPVPAPVVVAPPSPPPLAVEPAPVPEPAAEIAAAPPEGTLAPDVPAESIDDLMDDPESGAAQELPDEEDAASAAPALPAMPDVPARPEPPPAFESADEPPVEASAEPAASPDPAAADVPLLRDMPSDYRGAFPALRVDVHVYDEDPARRWVMLNGRKAVEGLTIQEGPTVSRITPEGIVFDFRGRRVLFPLNR